MSFNIVFMGTPKFSVPTLESLIKNKFNITKVYTQSPKKSKRGQKINPSPVDLLIFTHHYFLNGEVLRQFKEQ